MLKKTVQKLKNNTISFGKIICLLLAFYTTQAQSQTRIVIGKMENETPIITCDTAKLIKAMKRTLNDGTSIKTVAIQSANGVHYVLAQGIKMGMNKLAAFEIQYDMLNRTFYIGKQLTHVTCTAAACQDCVPYVELGRIIGCHCTERQTVSNQCNFTQQPISLFYIMLQQFIRN